jgi:hypothetical protein
LRRLGDLLRLDHLIGIGVGIIIIIRRRRPAAFRPRCAIRQLRRGFGAAQQRQWPGNIVRRCVRNQHRPRFQLANR